VLYGIRPGRRCHLKFGLPQIAAAIPHPAVAENKCGVLVLSSSLLPEPSTPQGALSGYLLVPAMARVVQRFVDFCCHP
jgi:hypothetical protein